MAAVDSLLRLLESQNAESLTLVENDVPRLSKAGVSQPLSMPPVGPAVMATFLADVLSEEQREALRGGATVNASYPPGEGHGYLVTAKPRGPGVALQFKRKPARAAAAASSLAPPPVAVPVAVPVPAPVASAAAAVTPVAATPGPVEPGTLAIYLARVAEDGASDLLLSSGQPARARVGGQWHELNGPVPDDAQIWALVEAAMSEAHRDALRRSGSCDLPYAATLHGRRLRFRVNLFRQHGGLAAAFRPIRRHPPTLDELNLPEALRALVGYPHGLVLVTGPTGAGKSTTLIALVEQLNREAARHIVTLEDPIEYEYTPQRSFIHQRELGAHVDSFEAGLRAALREAPDVILVGEMRDRATIAAALTAAQTGHLVLSSLHAASAAMAVERVVDVFPDYQQRQVRSELATSLRAVLTQQLLPTRGGERLPAIELCVVTAAVGALIRDDRTYQITSAIQTGREDGMIPLDRSLAELVASGRVELETAAAVTPDGGVQLRELLRAGASAPPRAPSPPREPPELRSGGRGPYR